MIGQTLDRYTVESKLGEGGMGVVYRARDSHLNRVVAIKVLPADKVSDPERRQRFVQEARAASALNHPNIVTIHDIRSDAGIDFIVMEHVGGRPLDDVIAGRPLRLNRALRYAIQIADALARAHEAGIVHRDLKPSNILVTDDHVVKVLDFGLAKLVDPVERAGETQTQTRPITDAGMIVGTAAYMSPEQAEGGKVDGRSDIFSFGAILYEMVTGRRAFEGSSPVSVLAKVLTDDPVPPSKTVPSIPTDVERAILRCLRKDPARRFQTMADLKVALDDLVDESGTLATVPPTANAPRRLAIAIVITMAVLAAGAYAAWKFGRAAPPPPDTSSRAVPLTTLAGIVRHPSFSPAGKHVAFSWIGPREDNADIYVQQIGAGTPLRLTSDPGIDISPVWSPDGRGIAFVRMLPDGRLELRLVPPLGGPERKITDLKPRGFLREVTLDWCRDSSCVVVTDHSAPDQGKPDVLFVVSLDSGERRQLTSSSTPEALLADTDPAVSPDGRWLVFRRDMAPFSGRLHVVALGDGMTLAGEPRPITPFLLTAYWPRWISNDEIVFAAKGSLWRTHIAPGSTPERVAFAGEDGVTPAVSPAVAGRPARLAYVRSYRDTNIWRIDTAGIGAPATGTPIKAIASTRRDSQPQLSPDGKSIVFISDRSGESELWISDVNGANAIQLTNLAANPGFPRWSPDGSLIAFHSNTEEGPAGDIFLMSGGGGKPQKMTSHPSTDTFATFSRDGRWIYFSSRRDGVNAMWRLPVTGGAPERVTSKTSVFAIEGTDRKDIFFVEGALLSTPGPLWRQPLAGGPPEKLVDGVAPLGFDVVDRGIYYFADAPAGSILFYDFATRRSVVVAKGVAPSNGGAGLSVSADGRTILFTRVDTRVDDLMLVDKFS